MTEMINLIVPPIIIVFTVAIFLFFLGKNLSSSSDGGSFVLKKNKNDSQSKKVKKRDLFKKKRGSLSSVFQEKKKNSDDDHQKQNVFSDGEDGGVYTNAHSSTKNGKGDKIVSLRKKSMVSDKIENAEGRDPVEIGLMQEIETEPHNSKKYEKLGDYYMEHEQFEDARECYKYVLRLDPRHKRAQVAMRNLDRVLN